MRTKIVNGDNDDSCVRQRDQAEVYWKDDPNPDHNIPEPGWIVIRKEGGEISTYFRPMRPYTDLEGKAYYNNECS